MKKTNHPRKGRKSKSGADQERRLARDQIPRDIPSLEDQLCVGFVFRFVTTSAFTGALGVAPQNLLDAWFIAGTATNAYQLFDFVRVKKVVVRAMGIADVSVSAAPFASVGIEYYGLSAGSFSGGRQKEDSSLGYDRPAYVELAPDPHSQVAQFQPSGGSSIFGIRAVSQSGNPLYGALIDVHVVLRNSADVNPAAVAVARAGLTPGALYFGGLDGNPLSTTAARSTFQKRAWEVGRPRSGSLNIVPVCRAAR